VNNVVYVVAAVKADKTEYWAAAVPRGRAVEQVRQSLAQGWRVTLTGWRLPAVRVATLNLKANRVCKI
jgi:hypothetical protein